MELCEHDPNADGLAVGAYPGFTPRLVIGGGEREDLAAYRAQGGYRPGLEGEALIEAVAASGLRGRGGGAFPTARKLQAVAHRTGPKILVANGEEGEPASIKDRWLMRERPHLVLDGVLRAAAVVGADEVWLYMSDRLAEASLEKAVQELQPSAPVIRLLRVAAGYVAGEESSVVRVLNGGPAKPTDKPPRPFEIGVGGHPTFISNVETFANLPSIAMQRAGDASVLLTISGAVIRPGLYEVPLGVRLGDAIDQLAIAKPGLRGFLMGGFFAGLMDTRALDLTLSYDAFKSAGSGVGCGAFIALGIDDCPIAAAVDVMAYFARENAGQCGACFRGTPAMAKSITALGLGRATDADLEKLQDWSVSLRGRGACATLDGAAQLAGTIFREFPEEVRLHRGTSCPRCQSLLPAGNVTRFAVGTTTHGM